MGVEYRAGRSVERGFCCRGVGDLEWPWLRTRTLGAGLEWARFHFGFCGLVERRVWFKYYGGSIADYFGDPGGHFGGAVANAHHAVSPDLAGMFDHFVECVGARPFTQFGIKGDLAARKGLEARADVSEERARAYNQAPDNPLGFYDRVPGDIRSRCGKPICPLHCAIVLGVGLGVVAFACPAFGCFGLPCGGRRVGRGGSRCLCWLDAPRSQTETWPFGGQRVALAGYALPGKLLRLYAPATARGCKQAGLDYDPLNKS